MDDRLVCASVKLPRGLRFLLERVSETLGMSMSMIIRLAVSQALNDGIKDISQYAYETDEYVITTFKVPLSVKKELKRMARVNMVSASEIVRLSLMRLIRTLTPYEGGYVDVYETVPAPTMPFVSIAVPVQEVVP
jgi:hypothetical protein